jgi:hypothetical protein
VALPVDSITISFALLDNHKQNWDFL